MKAYFIQELKRVLSRRYTFYILMAMLIFLLLHIPYNHAQAKNYMQKERNQAYADAYLIYSALDNAVIDGDKQEEDFYQKEYEDYYMLMQFYDSKEYTEHLNQKLQLQDDIYKREITWLKKKQDFPLSYELKELQKQGGWTSYMLNNEISPYATPYENQSANFFFLFLNNNVSLMIFTLIALSIVPMIVCKDFEEGVFKQIYTYSISRERILLSKLLVIIILIFCFLLISFGSIIVLTWLLYGGGSLVYPYSVAEDTLISAGGYFLTNLPLYLFTLLFLTILIFMFSYLCRKQVDTCIYFGLLMALFYVCMENQIFIDLQLWIPCFYLQGSLVVGRVFNIDLQQAVLLCVLYSIGMLVGLCVWFRKIDI